MSAAPRPPQLPWLREESAFLLLLAAFSILYILPLFLGGEWFVSHEMQHALVRLSEFHASFGGGRFPVRWSDNLMAGFGYPLFNFFPPFSFYLAEVFHFPGASLGDAWRLELIVARFAGAAGMYGFLRHPAGRRGAALGATMYLFAAYHASTLYVRGNLQEFTALCLWPLAFWGVEAVARHRHDWRGRAIPLAALAAGAFATTHMLTAYMGAFHLLAFGAFLLFRAAREESPRAALASLPLAVATGLLALGCAMYFLLPAIAEIGNTQSAVLTEGILYQEHFLTTAQLFRPTWGYGLSLPGPNDTMPLDPGVAVWGGVAAGVLLLALGRLKNGASLAAFVLAMFAATCFGMTEWSSPLWRVWPRAEYLQFPWRLLIPATFWGCAFAGIAVGRGWLDRLDLRAGRQRAAMIVALTVPALLVAPFLRPLLFDVEVPDYSPATLRGHMTNTMAGEYLPATVDTVPVRRSLAAIHARESGAVFETTRLGPAHYAAHVDLPIAEAVSFDVFHYDGWRVSVDGQDVETMPVSQYGLVGWRMESGPRKVEIRFGETRLRTAANVVSLLAHLAVVVWLLSLFFRRGGRSAAG